MNNIKNKAFTLVELLVVITILAILSVVAYQSFGWVTDKAQNTTKKSNVAVLGNTLWIFYTEENHYPMPQEYSSTNLWWYNSGATAQISNTISVEYNDQEVKNIKPWSAWGWIIYGSWTWAWTTQIAAKWVIWINWKFNKKYLKEKIYDVQLWDIKLTWETDKKMIDYGIGKFVYAVYARPAIPTNWNTSWTRWTYYTLATTFKEIEWEWYQTYLVQNYSKDNFSNNISNYPSNLIWLSQDEKDKNVATTNPDQWIPYPIDNFAR